MRIRTIFSACLTVAMAFGVVSMLAGCGASDLTTLKDASRQDIPLLVMMSGNATCHADPSNGATASPRGGQAWPFFDRVRADAASKLGIEIPWVASCHDSSSTSYFMTSGNTEVVTHEGYANILAAVNEQVRQSGATRLVMWGHSYGGWQALKAIAGINSKVPIDVISDDPISHDTCDYASWGGCTQGVADMSAAELNAIRERTTHWSNYYQKKTFFLHSQPIAQADENQQLPLTHFQIDTADVVWSRFQTLARGI